MRWVFCFLFLCFSIAGPLPLHAVTLVDGVTGSRATVDSEYPLWQEIKDGFLGRFNMVAFYQRQELRDIPSLPLVSIEAIDTEIRRGRLQEALPQVTYGVKFRPDFYYSFRRLELSVKPRLDLLRIEREKNPVRAEYIPNYKRTYHEENDYINEWLARIRLLDQLHVSYGRENLQWGPSYLISPSNPFVLDNGRNNTGVEIGGMDYAKVLFIANSFLSVNFIVNTDEGRSDFGRPFEEVFAAKIDFVGDGVYFSLIPSDRKGTDPRLGFYGGWAATDGMLLYLEGSVSGNREDSRFLVGSTYTFEMGPTVALEYYFHEDGCTDKPFSACPPQPATAFPVDTFERKQYMMLQYSHVDIFDKINVYLRLTQGLDDYSGHATGSVGYEIGDNVEFIVDGGVLVGGMDTEYGDPLDYVFQARVDISF